MTSLGLEEEYLLLEPDSGLPAHHAAEVQELLEAEPGITPEEIQRELLSCQIETATPVCETLPDAQAALLNFRRTLQRAASRVQSIAAATATAPWIRQDYPELTDKQRYEDLRVSAPGIVGDQFVNGLHVHVGIPDQDSGIQALNRIRPWIPLLTALSVNSPYWMGRDSGFGSWRVIHYRRWAVQGIPPVFADVADYERRITRLSGTGAILDRGVLTWVARLSDNFPTLELRACDVQLQAQDAVLLGALTRALVVTALREAEADAPLLDPDPELLDAALWQAARDGLNHHLVDLATAEPVPAGHLLRTFLDHVGPALESEGDVDRVQAGLATVAERGTGSERQRRALRDGGIDALLSLYRDTFTQEA
ncbi:YbdK family carboxylate-amine ligase [Arthrobacter echini]|uniref:Putative glutamate--cysteine ligase 2 n=1 Tax=Arthrobacter echini TaxID=1529066 RepID=A0A4S5E3X5_9MICC|nr:glutamate--cysteine ligase [Arthrobacter echini]THJ66146.1 YbdK family carboxylate-amine ligase [Arthrobacter echini]